MPHILQSEQKNLGRSKASGGKDRYANKWGPKETPGKLQQKQGI